MKRRRHSFKKTAFTFHLISTAKGEVPIEKNIMVVDEQGNEYEATWPKRARGLVKNSRARFISENKICLACPPDTVLEDKIMSDINAGGADIGSVQAKDSHLDAGEEQFGRVYILKQMEKILEQRDYLLEAIRSLSEMSDGDNGEAYGPGNTLGRAKAEALKEVVCYRETTNQQILKMYERMYYDQQKKDRAEQELKDYCLNVMKDPQVRNEEKMQYVRVIDHVMCVLKNDQAE